MRSCTNDVARRQTASLSRTLLSECTSVCLGDPACVGVLHHPETQTCELQGQMSRGWIACKRALFPKTTEAKVLRLALAACVIILYVRTWKHGSRSL